MSINRRAMLGALATTAAPLAVPTRAGAAAPSKPVVSATSTETIQLWPGPAPGSPVELPQPKMQKSTAVGRRDYHLKGIAAPVLFAYRPENPNGAAIIVMPGGGYAYLSMENEGTDIARWFTPRGYTVFVLSYRLPGEGWTNRADAPIEDGLRAMRVVRARAKDFKLDPQRIGVLGFSAGGHLAASVATGFATPLYENVDEMDAQSAKPDFVGLMYAVTTLKAPGTRSVSRTYLLGPDPTPELIARRSPLFHVDKDMPPCFVACALDDGVVDPACSIGWLEACRLQDVPVEAHFFQRGGHGFGLRLQPDNPGSHWPELFHLWMRRNGG